MASIDEVLTRRLAEGWHMRLETAPAGWRVLVRQGASGEWASLRAGHQGFAIPLDAVADADDRISALLAAREDASAKRDLGDLVRALVEGRLERRKGVSATGVGDGPDEWVMHLPDGSETEPAPHPVEAIRRAHGRGRV